MAGNAHYVLAPHRDRRLLTCLLQKLGLAIVLTATACGNSDSPGPDLAWRDAFDAQQKKSSWLLSTWGSSAEDRYVVGGSPSAGVVMHSDGDDWTKLKVPGKPPLLNWVFGFKRNDVWMVGEKGTVLHFDGDDWLAHESPTEEALWGIWGASPKQLWAVGGSGRPGAEATLLRYENDTWAKVELPKFRRAGVRALFKVWGSGKDNVFAVGQNGVVLQYDGVSWTELLVGASDDLIAVWGTGPEDVVAVGGRGNGIVSHYDGKKWSTNVLRGLPGINGVWMQTPGVAHLAITKGRLAVLDVGAPDNIDVFEQETPLDFHGIFGTDRQLTAVGGNFEAVSEAALRGIAVERALGPAD